MRSGDGYRVCDGRPATLWGAPGADDLNLELNL